MSKGLEELDLLKQCITDTHFNRRDFVDIAFDVERSSNAIEKELKAFEIIKKHYEVCECYKNQYIMTDGHGGSVQLTQAEYDLLKEELKWND